MRRTRTRAAIAAVVVAVLVTGGCSDGQVERDDSDRSGYVEGDGTVATYPPAERAAAPEFSGPLLAGDGTFTLDEAQGDVVVLNVWGSWCPPCRKEAPELQSVYEALAEQGVRFVGVNIRDHTKGPAQAFEQEFGITYPSVYDPKGEALLAFRDTIPPQAIPSTLVIDRAGRIAGRVVGPITETSLRQMVADIAAEDTSAT